MNHRLLLFVVAIGTFASWPRSAWAGPAWIAVEAPALPWPDRGRDSPAFLVHLRGHVDDETHVEATAEGLVDGERRSVPVTLRPTVDPRTFAVSPSWPRRGTWTVVIRASGHLDSYALLNLGSKGLTRHKVNGHAVYAFDDVDIHSAVGRLGEAQIDRALRRGEPPVGPGRVDGAPPSGGGGPRWPAAVVLGLLASALVLGTTARRHRLREPRNANELPSHG